MIIHEMADGVLTLLLKGEIDHHSVAPIRTETDELLKKYGPEKTVIDFGGVTFCDSSGIAYVMGRYRLLQSLGGSLALTNVPSKILTIFQMAGMEKMIAMKAKEELK